MTTSNFPHEKLQSVYQLGMFPMLIANYLAGKKGTWLFMESVLIATGRLLLPGPSGLGNVFLCVSVNNHPSFCMDIYVYSY